MTDKATLLTQAVPALRSFGYTITQDFDRADDLVQETLAKAWANWKSFQEGTNLNAWLFTILRNQFYTDLRKRKREVDDSDGKYAASLAALPHQEPSIDLKRVTAAVAHLPEEQRAALMLLVDGLTYEEVGEVMGVPAGTVKSRVSRARARLARTLGIDGFESDAVNLAAYGSAARVIA